MKYRVLALLCAVWMLAQIAASQTTENKPMADNKAILGVWRAQMDGLPALTLVVTDESGSLSGAVLFWLHMRKTVNDPYTATPGLPEPIFHPQFDGTTLTFQVSHRRAHPPRTLSDPPVTFTLKLTGPNQAELANKSERGPTVALVRSDD
jgi:hypothetical protein